MAQKSPLKIVILGAGPSGLCAAWNLVQDGHQVTVIEKEPVCGGQSITFQENGYKYDLGPHNIHPQRKSIINFLKGNLGNEFVHHKFSSQIYFRGHRIDYPFVGVDILKSMDLFTIISCILSFILSRISSFFMPKFKDNGNYKTWIINRFGRKFYNIYFGPYSEKVWNMSASEISDIVAKKRIAVSGIIELIHSIIFKQQKYHPENPSTTDNYYPQNGVGSIIDFFVRGILEGGGKIITRAAIEKVVVNQFNIKQIFYSINGKTECFNFQLEGENSACKVLSTIPINELIMMLEGDVPEAVETAARQLDFTSEVFLYLNVDKPNIFNIPLLYFSEPEFPFNRIYDVGIFSREMVPEGKNALCLEISCKYNDEIWNMDNDTLFKKCLEPLEKHNLLSSKDIETYHTRRLKHAYPCFRVGYERKLNTIFNYISRIRNFYSFGREGLFVYANVDDAIWMGFEIAKNVNYCDRIGLTIKELLPSYISF